MSSQIWCYLILDRWVDGQILKNIFESNFMSSQIWCYLILDGWVGMQMGGPEKNVLVQI